MDEIGIWESIPKNLPIPVWRISKPSRRKIQGIAGRAADVNSSTSSNGPTQQRGL
jgi:hypothetical protein